MSATTVVRHGAAPGASPRPARHRAGRAVALAAWTLLALVAVRFVAKYTLHYLAPGGTERTNYATRALALRVHIVAGGAALFMGLAQLRSGISGRRRGMHRWMGRAYVGCVAVGSLAAVALLRHASANWVFATGLWGLAAAWVGTTGLAYVAIRRGDVAQHREWMTRSYVVTFAFVMFRALFELLGALHVGTVAERAAFASWCCWAAPLLLAELTLQGRKVLAPASSRHRFRSSPTLEADG